MLDPITLNVGILLCTVIGLSWSLFNAYLISKVNVREHLEQKKVSGSTKG